MNINAVQMYHAWFWWQGSVILRRLEFHFCAIDFDVTIETKTPTAVQPRTCDFKLN